MNTENYVDKNLIYKEESFKLKGYFDTITYSEINNYLYDNLLIGITSIFILASILFLELSGHIEKTKLTIWYVFVLFIVALRIGLLIWYHKTKHNTNLQDYHYKLFVIGSSLSAVLWGIIGSILMPDNVFYQTFILIMISGIMAGSIISLGARYFPAMLYVFISLLPIIAWEGIQVLNGKRMYLGIFLAMSLYLLYASITAFKSSNLILNNINLKNENINLLKELKLYLNQIELFSQLGESLEKCRSNQEIGDACKKYIPLIFPEFSGGISLISKKNENMIFFESWNGYSKTEQIQDFCKDDCYASKTKKLHISTEASRCKHCLSSTAHYFCIPLQTLLEFFGVLHLKSSTESLQKSPQEKATQKDLITRVAANISFALSTIQYEKLLEAEATEDTLTGLYNRRYLDKYFHIELARYKRKPISISVIMIDIDHFKFFNDRYGHEIGDQVLHGLGLILKKCVRGSDFACRYGGEEFILIMPDTDLNAAENRAEKIRKEVKNFSITKGATTIKNLTVSMGIAIFPAHGNTQAAIIEAADKALYCAKIEGRDRICLASA